MKKTIFFLLALVAAFVSCDKVETDNEKSKEATGKNEVIATYDTLFFTGTLLANASSGDCQTPDTKVSINYTDKADSVSITIFKAKLAQRMPAMDIIIPGINIEENSGNTVITSDRSVPLAMGGNEFSQYTVTEFSGEFTAESLSFSLKFGSTPTSFTGQYQE